MVTSGVKHPSARLSSRSFSEGMSLARREAHGCSLSTSLGSLRNPESNEGAINLPGLGRPSSHFNNAYRQHPQSETDKEDSTTEDYSDEGVVESAAKRRRRALREHAGTPNAVPKCHRRELGGAHARQHRIEADGAHIVQTRPELISNESVSPTRKTLGPQIAYSDNKREPKKENEATLVAEPTKEDPPSPSTNPGYQGSHDSSVDNASIRQDCTATGVAGGVTTSVVNLDGVVTRSESRRLHIPHGHTRLDSTRNDRRHSQEVSEEVTGTSYPMDRIPSSTISPRSIHNSSQSSSPSQSPDLSQQDRKFRRQRVCKRIHAQLVEPYSIQPQADHNSAANAATAQFSNLLIFYAERLRRLGDSLKSTASSLEANDAETALSTIDFIKKLLVIQASRSTELHELLARCTIAIAKSAGMRLGTTNGTSDSFAITDLWSLSPIIAAQLGVSLESSRNMLTPPGTRDQAASPDHGVSHSSHKQSRRTPGGLGLDGSLPSSERAVAVARSSTQSSSPLTAGRSSSPRAPLQGRHSDRSPGKPTRGGDLSCHPNNGPITVVPSETESRSSSEATAENVSHANSSAILAAAARQDFEFVLRNMGVNSEELSEVVAAASAVNGVAPLVEGGPIPSGDQTSIKVHETPDDGASEGSCLYTSAEVSDGPLPSARHFLPRRNGANPWETIGGRTSEKNKQERACSNCHCKITPQWRFIENIRYCNACYMRHKRLVGQQRSSEHHLLVGGASDVLASAANTISAKYRDGSVRAINLQPVYVPSHPALAAHSLAVRHRTYEGVAAEAEHR